MTKQIIWQSPGFEDAMIVMDAPENVTATIFIKTVLPIEVGDEVNLTGFLELYDGEPVTAYHGEVELFTLTNNGLFDGPSFTASHDGSDFTIVAPGPAHHKFAFLEVSRDV